MTGAADVATCTATEGSTLLGVAASTIRNWASEGEIVAVGVRGNAKLYRYRDLVEAEYRRRKADLRNRATEPRAT